jgi:hypothetical protein
MSKKKKNYKKNTKNYKKNWPTEKMPDKKEEKP